MDRRTDVSGISLLSQIKYFLAHHEWRSVAGWVAAANFQGTRKRSRFSHTFCFLAVYHLFNLVAILVSLMSLSPPPPLSVFRRSQ